MADSGVTCGFIGLGMLGAPMARRMLNAGYPLLVWDRSPESLAPFAETGARVAGSAAEVGAAADHVGVCVIDDAGVIEVCEALIGAMKPGGRIAIHATVSPAACRALADRAAERGVFVIDAPVTGIGGAAEAGALAVMVGGEAEPVAAARPVLETFGQIVLHLGPGAGQTAKLIHNSITAANMSVAHNALQLARALGFDPKALAQVCTLGTGRSYAMELVAALPTPGAFIHGADLLMKDLQLLKDIAGGQPAARALLDLGMPYMALIKEDAGKRRP